MANVAASYDVTPVPDHVRVHCAYLLDRLPDGIDRPTCSDGVDGDVWMRWPLVRGEAIVVLHPERVSTMLWRVGDIRGDGLEEEWAEEWPGTFMAKLRDLMAA